MLTMTDIRNRLAGVFDEEQAQALTDLIQEAFNQMVKTGDFNDLKTIVKDLAEAQQHTELRMEELAQAQRHTEQRMEDLVLAQQQTEMAMQKMLKGMERTRDDMGSLSLSQRYVLENEARAALPHLLAERHAIVIDQKLIRAEIGGQEIHIFGRASRQGLPVVVVGEVRLRLEETKADDIHPVFDTLESKIQAVRREYQDTEIVAVLTTHFARGSFLRQATERGVIVFQSFEW